LRQPDPSALYLLVPSAEVLLSAVRDLPGVSLLEPAHVSLGYPWVSAAAVALRLDEVRAVAAATPPIPVVLDGPHRFDVDVRGRQVVHLRPDSDEPFLSLAAALGAPLRTPHLSVARVLASGSVASVEDVLRPLLPLRTTITQLEVTVRVAPGRWERALLADLGQDCSALR
jgi:hypothetical protein